MKLKFIQVNIVFEYFFFQNKNEITIGILGFSEKKVQSSTHQISNFWYISTNVCNCFIAILFEKEEEKEEVDMKKKKKSRRSRKSRHKKVENVDMKKKKKKK